MAQEPQAKKPNPNWKGKAVPVVYPITTEPIELQTIGIIELKKHVKGPWRGMYEAYEVTFNEQGEAIEKRIQAETTIDMVLNAVNKNLHNKAYPSK